MSTLRTVRLVAGREIRQRGRSRLFLLSCAVVVLGIATLVALPSLLNQSEQRRRIGLVGSSPALLPDALQASAASLGTPIEVLRYPDVQTGEDALRAKTVDVLVVDGTELVWRGETDPELSALVTVAAQAAERQQRAIELGLTPAQTQELMAAQPLGTRSLEPTDPTRTAREGPVMIGVILLYLAVAVYGSFVLTGVVEEKSNRVVEVLLSRIRPYQLVAGKVAGIGVLALGQFALAGVAALAARAIVADGELPSVGAGLVASLLLWFVLGFALYSVLNAGFGALASRQEDAQSVSLPITIFAVAGYFIALSSVESPTGALAIAGSFFPFSAPFVMPVRVAMSDVPAWQIVAAVVLTIGTIYLMIRVAGRIYSGAVMRVGPRVKLAEAWRSGGERTY